MSFEAIVKDSSYDGNLVTKDTEHGSMELYRNPSHMAGTCQSESQRRFKCLISVVKLQTDILALPTGNINTTAHA